MAFSDARTGVVILSSRQARSDRRYIMHPTCKRSWDALVQVARV